MPHTNAAARTRPPKGCLRGKFTSPIRRRHLREQLGAPLSRQEGLHSIKMRLRTSCPITDGYVHTWRSQRTRSFRASPGERTGNALPDAQSLLRLRPAISLASCRPALLSRRGKWIIGEYRGKHYRLREGHVREIKQHSTAGCE